MQTVILAGGVGKRTHPLGINKPKAMFRVAGKPIIQHVLDQIKEANINITKLVVVVGPGENAIVDYLEKVEGFGFDIKFSIQERPTGQAGALLAARKHIDEDFLVMNANDIYDSSLLGELVQLGQSKSLNVALVGREVKETEKFGIMGLNSKGKLVGVVEKPPKGTENSNLAVVGLYYFSSKIWKALDETPIGSKDDQYERAYQNLINKDDGDPFVRYEGPYDSFKLPWDLFAISDLLLTHRTHYQISKTAQVSPLAVVEGDVFVGDNVRILEYAVVRGPAYIGAGTIVGNHALIRPGKIGDVIRGVSIGENCVIGHSTEITRSIIGDNCWTHKNFIGDSIISDNCSFGAGTITANLRFDEAPIKIEVGENRISSNQNYFGVIMAEDCRTGCNVVLSPGVKIGPNSAVGPGVTLIKDLTENKIALLSRESYKEVVNDIKISDLSREKQIQGLRKHS